MNIQQIKAGQKDTFKASFITLFNEDVMIAKKAFISKVNAGGFSLSLNYKDLVLNSLKFQLNLSPLLRKKILMYIPDMGIDLEGVITAVCHKGHGNFEITLQFFKETPQYWRECLADLWPGSKSLISH